MDNEDDGYFHYNDKFPPICIRPPYPKNQPEDQMTGVITEYLKESYKYGLKDPNALLPSGLAAGEAAIIYFRTASECKKSTFYNQMEITKIIQSIQEAILKYLDVDIHVCTEKFTKYINGSIFYCKQYKKRLLSALKAYLTEMGLKSKGYTYKLKQIMSEVV